MASFMSSAEILPSTRYLEINSRSGPPVSAVPRALAPLERPDLEDSLFSFPERAVLSESAESGRATHPNPKAEAAVTAMRGMIVEFFTAMIYPDQTTPIEQSCNFPSFS
jgi:hypothetical protein